MERYVRWPEGRLEAAEGLEQLRFIEQGARVSCVPVDPKGHEFWEVNNPKDIQRVEGMLAKRGFLI